MTGWLIQTLVATDLLILLVLLLRGHVARWFGPRAAYALWLLPALRQILPSLPGARGFYFPVLTVDLSRSRVSLSDPITAVHAILPAVAAHHDAVIPPLLPLAQIASSIGPVLISALITIWLVGALLCFGVQMLRYKRFVDRATRSASLLTRVDGVDFLITHTVDGPMAAGIFKRRVFLPADFRVRYTPEERRLALAHEAAHHQRYDILANLVALAVVAAHWSNPLAHRAYRAFRADQELACDATVLARSSGRDRHAYGSALLKSASVRVPSAACALNPKAELTQRIRMIAARPPGAPRLLLGGMVVAAAVAVGLLVTASSTSGWSMSFGMPGSIDAAVAKTEAQQRQLEAQQRQMEAQQRQMEAQQRAAEAQERQAEEQEREAEAQQRQAEAQERQAEEQQRQAEAQQRQVEAADRARALHVRLEQKIREADGSIRRALAEECAAAGAPMPTDADLASLQGCGERLKIFVRDSLEGARSEIASQVADETARAKALAAVDRVMARAARMFSGDDQPKSAPSDSP